MSKPARHLIRSEPREAGQRGESTTRRLGVTLFVLAVAGGLSACSLTKVTEGKSSVSDRSEGTDRVSLNPIMVASRFARAPEGDEVVALKKGWESHIPETNENLPVGYPFVEDKDLTVAQLDELHAEQLTRALEVVEQETGIGPWEVAKTGGLSCGPAVTGHRTGAPEIGSSTKIFMETTASPTDEQFFEVIDILGRFYPGIAEPQNQFHTHNEVGHRAYDLLTDDDAKILLVYKTGGDHGMTVTLQTGCYLTKDQVAWALDKDLH